MSKLQTQRIKRAYLVSHTHWDREWYLPKEKFQLLLVDLIDRLLKILDEDREYNAFMLDGQTIALEDYLEIRPEAEEKIRKYVSQGRILIGPWYVLPDELLISGEAHIRNYLLGEEMCSRFGGNMRCGYLPDAFGHPSQMPQIIKKLGMDEIVFWRGVGPELDKNEFIWHGLDGSEIFAVNLPFSYGNAARLPIKKDNFVKRIKREVKRLESMSCGETVLLMNGVDHMAPEFNLPERLKQVKGEFDFDLLHSTLPAFLEDIKQQDLQLEHYSGELRSPKRGYLLSGTLSTRMYLKQENFQVEQLLEKYLEPLAALVYIKTGKYPESELKWLWKNALKNLPHDSICGCSIDEVHRDMMQRYREIKNAGSFLLHKLRSEIENISAAETGELDGTLMIFNPLAQERSDYADFEIDVQPRLERKVDFDIGGMVEFAVPERLLPKKILISDQNGNRQPAIIEHAGLKSIMELSLDDQPRMHQVIRLSGKFKADSVPPSGISSYRYKLIYEPAEINLTCAEATQGSKEDITLGNEYFEVQCASNTGLLQITDKASGVVYENCHQFIDMGDAGDEYTYSPPEKDLKVKLVENSVQVRWLQKDELVQSIEISGVMRLPAKLEEDRSRRSSQTVDCPLKSIISLPAGVRRIDIKTEFVNKAEDHRLSVLFTLPFAAKSAQAESMYAVDKHQVLDLNDQTDYSDWIEAPSGTICQKTFTDVSNERYGLAIANKGLPEITVRKDGQRTYISLTLLRCIGWLSRKDLLSRKGNAGWSLETPEAQCPGKSLFEYSIIPHQGNWQSGSVRKQAHQFAVPLKVIHYPDLKSFDFSLFKLSANSIATSAIKKALRAEALIIRLYNQSDNPVETSIQFAFPIEEIQAVSLDERPVHEYSFQHEMAKLQFKPWEIITLMVRQKNDRNNQS